MIATFRLPASSALNLVGVAVIDWRFCVRKG
jgi:hypothetical protein